MSYLPKHKQVKGGKVDGTLVDAKTGAKYLGKFVADHQGNYYKGEVVSPKADKLLVVPHAHDAEAGKYKAAFVSHFPKPKDKDYQRGVLVRYFVKDIRNGKIYEVNKQRFIHFKREAKTSVRILKLEWYIKGNPEDEVIKGYIYPGLKAKNADVVKQAEKIIPGIGRQLLKDKSQFVKML